jgi:1,4-dihydroxy-2-naphthoate octaprenyltransferase
MRIALWIKASRAPFFCGVVAFVCVGAAAAWYDSGTFHVLPFAACVLGVMLINGGTNLANDYYDHVSGADEANDFPTPFSGGSRAIQDGVFTPRQMRGAALMCFAAAGAVGAYLVWHAGPLVLALGAVGVFSGFFYTAPPLRLGYRGLGEIVTGVNFGLLPVVGAYYVQTQALDGGIALVGMAPCFLGAALLLINEIPDAEADRKAGKRHLVTRMSSLQAAVAYLAVIAGAYAVIAVALWARLAPPTAVLAFGAVPVGLVAFGLSYRWAVRSAAPGGAASGPAGMAPAMAANVVCLILTSALLCVGYLVGGTAVG